MSWLVKGDGARWVMDADGTEQGSGVLQQLTDREFADEFPAWRPLSSGPVSYVKRPYHTIQR